jgi:small subunit ribosomal protein S27Ae
MQVFVKTLAGETLALEVSAVSTVQSLKAQIELAQGVAAECQRLVFQGKNLDDAATFAALEIKEEATIHLVMDLDGGKKKKKKVYDKPKKQKHKNKKIKLRVLNYYKVRSLSMPYRCPV